MGELFRADQEKQARAASERLEADERYYAGFVRAARAAAPAAIATIIAKKRFNSAYENDRRDRKIGLNWKGDTQLAWNIRPLFPLDYEGPTRFIAFVETGDIVFVSQQRSGPIEVELYDPKRQGLSLDDVGNVFSQLLFLVDDADFTQKYQQLMRQETGLR